MTLSWLSVDASTGKVVADLTNLKTDGALKQTLMRYESQTASLPMDKAPSNWRVATRPGGVFLVALDEQETPLWGGLVIGRTRAVGDGVQVSMVTAEGWLDRVYIGDEPYMTATPQNTIVKNVVEKYAKTGAKRGLPIRVEIVGGTGVARSKTTWTDAADKTLYSALQDFSGLIGGPEWTIGWEWVDDATLGLVFYVGDRIGSPAPVGLNPAAQFYLPGAVTAAELEEGYQSGSGANDIMAVSTGTEGARPVSDKWTNTTDFRPRFEYRWTPETDIKLKATLNSHAQRALAAMKDGAIGLSITANRQEAPQLGADWRIGDDIGFDITAPEFPDGLVGTARCVGWELTETTITPLVDVTNVEGVQ